jgi:hypothetical protein
MKSFFASSLATSLPIFLWLNIASATTPEYIELQDYPRIEVTLSGGTALQSGYLTQDDSAGAYSIGVNFGLPRGFFAFEWQGFRAEHNTGEFALQNNKAVTAASFSFVPYFRVCEHGGLSFLLGLGFEQVELTQTDPAYDINYGTFTAGAILRYQLTPKWSLHYKTSWYGVEQTVADQKTRFEVWNHLAGVGYGF